MRTKHDLTVYDIAALIRSFLKEDITPEDNILLKSWIAESPANGRLLEKLTATDWRNSEIEKMLQYSPTDKWQKIVAKARRKRNMRLLYRYSTAAALVIIGLGISLFLHQEQIQEISPLSSNDMPTIARLTTSNGETIALDSLTGQLSQHISLQNGNEIVFSKIDTPDIEKTPDIKYNTLEIMRGGEYHIVLPDGTTVFLNSQTTLKFPDHFTNTQNRKVYLSGEALFKVAKDETKPFIVECRDYTVKVLGTVFNISDYPDDSFSHTTLKEGKVEIGYKEEKIILEPGLQALLENGKMTVQEVEVDNYTTWMNENFRFKSENIDRILKQLARWYDFEVFYLNAEVKNYHFSGYLPRYGKVSEVLELLSNTTDIHFEVKGKVVMVGKK